MPAKSFGWIPTDRPRMEIVLARHGETEWSGTARHTGRTDIPLTDHGRAEAARLRAALAGAASSACSRARWSGRSRPAGSPGWAMTPRPREDLLEWDYGEYEGITTPEIREGRPGLVALARRLPRRGDARPTWERAWTALSTALRALEGDAALFAHGHVLRVLPRAGWASARGGRAVRARDGHAVGARLRARDARDQAVERAGACPA